MLYNVPWVWEIHIKQEMTGIHGFVRDYVVVLSLICFNRTENCLMYSWKNVHLVICCHFEVIYHDVVN